MQGCDTEIKGLEWRVTPMGIEIYLDKIKYVTLPVGKYIWLDREKPTLHIGIADYMQRLGINRTTMESWGFAQAVPIREGKKPWRIVTDSDGYRWANDEEALDRWIENYRKSKEK